MLGLVIILVMLGYIDAARKKKKVQTQPYPEPTLIDRQASETNTKYVFIWSPL